MHICQLLMQRCAAIYDTTSTASATAIITRYAQCRHCHYHRGNRCQIGPCACCGWLRPGCRLAEAWLQAAGWFLAGCCWLAVGLLLACCWLLGSKKLLTGCLLAMCRRPTRG